MAKIAYNILKDSNEKKKAAVKAKLYTAIIKHELNINSLRQAY